MFTTFFSFELKSWLRSPMPWIFLFIIGLLCFFGTISDQVGIGGSYGNVWKNAPFVAQNWYGVFSILCILLTTAFMNTAGIRDYENQTSQIIFSKPVDKAGYYFGHFANYPADWLSDVRFQSGLVLFIFGAAINVYTDYKLISLRKPGETGYKIPQGGIFNYLSCPNHFGEILEWVGYAVLSWSLPGLVFAFWTFANLAPRALAHHRWYQEQFPNYPVARKALLPFFW